MSNPKQLNDDPPALGLPETPIKCGRMQVYLKSDLTGAAEKILVGAKTLVRSTDCDNETLWKLEEAYRVLAQIIDRLESEDPTITAADRNLGYVRSE
jgi:hypothetical protein